MSAAPELDAWNNLPLITFVNIQSDGDGGKKARGKTVRHRGVAVFAHLFRRRRETRAVWLSSAAVMQSQKLAARGGAAIRLLRPLPALREGKNGTMEVLSNEGRREGERVGCNPEDMEDVLPTCEVVIRDETK